MIAIESTAVRSSL